MQAVQKPLLAAEVEESVESWTRQLGVRTFRIVQGLEQAIDVVFMGLFMGCIVLRITLLSFVLQLFLMVRARGRREPRATS